MPSLPFLAIMLGLMSVMALTTIGIAVESRQEQKQNSIIELVGIPANFIPFYMRCSNTSLMWLDDDNIWRSLPAIELIPLMALPETYLDNSPNGSEFLRFIKRKINENRALSFQRRQHTLVLWVEPGGVDTATIVQYFISHNRFPLRVGLLPILHGETIARDSLQERENGR
jgi:hypothetical protein